MNWIDLSGMTPPAALPDGWDFRSTNGPLSDAETAACGDRLLLTMRSPDITEDGILAVRDHVNLSGSNPLRGHNNNDLGVRFPDMSHPYDLPENCKENSIVIRAGQNNDHPYDAVDAPGIVYQTILAKHQLKTVQALIYGNAVGPEDILKLLLGE